MAAGRNSGKPDGAVFRIGGSAETQPAEGGPIRRCVVCRKSGIKSEMIRFVSRNEVPAAESAGILRRVLRIDPAQTADGRGAYCHCDPACAASRGLIEQLVRSLVSAEARSGKERIAVSRPPALVELIEFALAESKAGNSAGISACRRIGKLAKLLDSFGRGRSARQSREPEKLESGEDALKSAGTASGKVSVPKLRL